MNVGVMGAGAIGCFVGGALAEQGVPVTLVGRARTAAELGAHGLTLVRMDGKRSRVAVPAVATEPSALASCDVVLCCVKSGETATVGATLAGVLARDAIVVSLQNGVRNADVLRAALPGHVVLGGIVGFNVVAAGDGVFRQTTTGLLVVEAAPDPRVRELEGALARAGLEVEVTPELPGMQWAKLMMNLNNAVSALSGAPTPVLLFTAGYRRILAALIDEALAVMRVAGVKPARLGAIPVSLFPMMLRLPTPVLRVALRAQLRVDPEARSSMWQDLDRRRLTEVDFLNGEIVRLAEKHGLKAPLNARIVELVHEVEARREGSPNLTPEALLHAIGAARLRIAYAGRSSPWTSARTPPSRRSLHGTLSWWACSRTRASRTTSAAS